MAIATHLLTYDDYMCSPEEMRRYEILDGEKVYMTNPTIRHQKIIVKLYSQLEAWQSRKPYGTIVIAPCDVLIRRAPLRTRQPDLLFISAERFGGRSLDNPAPLEPAPELVVEILSPSDRRRVLAGKLDDYRSVGVQECWIVSPGERTVEVLRLSPEGDVRTGIFGEDEEAQSSVFPDLRVSVNAILAG
jgi:Uma2 family endonuclease